MRSKPGKASELPSIELAKAILDWWEVERDTETLDFVIKDDCFKSIRLFSEEPDFVSKAKHYPNDTAALIEAVLNWWEKHSCDVILDYCEENETEEYNLFDNDPKFITMIEGMQAS